MGIHEPKLLSQNVLKIVKKFKGNKNGFIQ